MSTIIGGFPVSADGRVRTHFTHNPSSLRLSSTDPNLQNIPRAAGSEIAGWVKDIFVAPEGSLFWARDFSGIEAVLVGYFVGSCRYTRLAKLGVHAFLTSHIVGRPADLTWSDNDLRGYFKVLKGENAVQYDTAKRIVHGSNYMMTPSKMRLEYPETFPTTASASKLQGLYFELFPEIKEWHFDLCKRVDGTRRKQLTEGEEGDPWSLGVAWVKNPFGYVHRFYNVLDWERIILPSGNKEWFSSFGEDAKRLISFLPQSTAAAIIKKSAKEIYYNHPEVGETLRLLIHDECFGECRERDLDLCLRISKEVMEAPILELPLDPVWGMGPFLTIGTEAKVGKSWGSMKTVKES